MTLLTADDTATTDTPARRVVVAMMTARAWIALVAALRGMGGGG